MASSITLPAWGEPHAHVRPLNILRDLPAVADLVELCFADTMDGEGRRYLQDMRRSGGDSAFLNWANRVAETTSMPLTGYIWEEGGRIVGNVSIVPFWRNGTRLYLIANVAVHPEFRRRGIARALTERTLQHARDKKIKEVWLNVRQDNPEALRLYHSVGFLERARRTSWKAPTDAHAQEPSAGMVITSRHPRHWETQRQWLERLYPDLLAWHRKWNFHPLRPGLWGWLHRFLMDGHVRQWAAVRNDNLLATLSWIPSGGGDGLFAGTGGTSDPEALTALLIRARRELYHLHPSVSLEFPVSRFDDAIRAAGFKSQRTLIWMQATL